MGKISNLQKYATKSKLMDIKIVYQGERIKFNLFEELVINENKVNSELKDQPGYYGFLLLLHKKLIRVSEDKKIEADKLWGKSFTDWKGEKDTATGRPHSKEMAKEMANQDEPWLKAISNYFKAKEQAGIIDSCVRSFEQRGHLIQSIAANLRKEQ